MLTLNSLDNIFNNTIHKLHNTLGNVRMTVIGKTNWFLYGPSESKYVQKKSNNKNNNNGKKSAEESTLGVVCVFASVYILN